MQKQGFYLSNAEILAFFRRIDKNNSARISFNEFRDYLLPDSSFVTRRANQDITFSRKSDDYLSLNPSKYEFKSYASTSLRGSDLIGTYKVQRGSPYKNTPYLASKPHQEGSYNYDTTNYYPQSSQYEPIKAQNIYPSGPSKYFGGDSYPAVQRHLYSYENNNKGTNSLFGGATNRYYTSEYFPQASHRSYPELFKSSLPLKTQDLKSSSPPLDSFNKKPYYEDLEDKKYMHAKDLVEYAKNLDRSNLGRTPEPTTSTKKEALNDLTPQKEAPAVGKFDDWKINSRKYDENYVKYGPERTPWSVNSGKYDPTNLDLLMSANTIRADILMNSSILKDPKTEKFFSQTEEY